MTHNYGALFKQVAIEVAPEGGSRSRKSSSFSLDITTAHGRRVQRAIGLVGSADICTMKILDSETVLIGLQPEPVTTQPEPART
jgi:hypothetical protein